ncbi:Arm DNA-binding domain-containing protein [Zoogloea sp.]|jgi:integrase|uniref:Arm DNA-binding domain-containing protein n=1 Tax=Zoogloea sp. TaxID=49181 RepID=UPI0035B113E2
MASIRARADSGKLFFDFRFQGVRCREQTLLDDTPANRRRLEKVLQRIDLEIHQGVFDYSAFFPGSKLAATFAVTGCGAPRETALGQSVLQMGSPAVVSAPQPHAPVAAPITRPTLGTFAETWQLENQVTWRRSYQRTVSDIVTKHLLPRFGARDVGSLLREELLQFRSELAKVKGRKKETLSPRRINAIMNVMSLILAEASDRYKFTSPYYNIKPLRIPKSDVEPFTLAEVQRILDTVREDFRDYYTVRFFTGMRTGEVDGLKWKYVDFERQLILVRETIVLGVVEEDAKTIESVRDIQMSQVVFDALKRQLARSGRLKGFVFCSGTGHVLDHNNITKRIWYPLLRHLGLKKRRPYQTRHTAATLWLAAGENPEWIARQMGHTSTEMLFKVYSRYVPNLTRKDGSAFERLLSERFASSAQNVVVEGAHLHV